MEFTGPLVRLAVGQSVSLTVVWDLYSLGPESSAIDILAAL